ncbi:hypothetical protein PQZ39_00280 [bacterium]|nr:hypothetical protein [bacterium]
MNLFDWLKEINNKKSPVNSFTQEDWDNWNSYMVHRFLSMDPDLLELVNEVQKLPPTDKKKIYSIYKEFIPKNNKWNKYIKSTLKQRNKELIEYLKGYFQLSTREVKEYRELLGDEEILRILSQLGIDNKSAKKLLK